MPDEEINALDSVTCRGKRKDAKVNNPSFFVAGMIVDFLRENVLPGKGFRVVGTATIESVNITDKVLKFDALPKDVRVTDLVCLHSNTVWPRGLGMTDRKSTR